MRITVFGATGQAGRCISKMLLEDPSHQVAGCSRSAERLGLLKSSLDGSAETFGTRVVDVQSRDQVVDAIFGSDLAVSATSRSTDGPLLAKRALQSGASYLGIHLSSEPKWTRLRSLHEACMGRGLMIVDYGGAHPGLPGAMIRYAAKDGKLASARVAGKFALKWNELDVEAETIEDFVAEIESMQPVTFRDGVRIRGFRHARAFDFGTGRGPETRTPMLLVKLHLRWASKLMWWRLRRFASESPAATLVLEAWRESDGKPVRPRVSHSDPYILTAAPAVETIRQMIADPKPGVRTQAEFVGPLSFFENLRRRGISVEP